MLKVNQFTYNPFQENTYILEAKNGQCAIIDPGFYDKNEEAQFFAYIEENGLEPVLLINTHCHMDHVFGIHAVQKKYGLSLHIHPNERPILDRIEDIAAMYGLKVDIPTPNLKMIGEGDVVELADLTFQVILTPGHSPGSICLYHEGSRILIAGDVLFYGSIGRTDLPFGDYDTLISSIHKKLFPLGDDVKVYSGHGPVTSIGFERANNPFLQVE